MEKNVFIFAHRIISLQTSEKFYGKNLEAQRESQYKFAKVFALKKNSIKI